MRDADYAAELRGWTEKVREVMALDPGDALDELDAQQHEHLVWFAFAALTLLHGIELDEVDDDVRRRALGEEER